MLPEVFSIPGDGDIQIVGVESVGAILAEGRIFLPPETGIFL